MVDGSGGWGQHDAERPLKYCQRPGLHPGSAAARLGLGSFQREAVDGGWRAQLAAGDVDRPHKLCQRPGLHPGSAAARLGLR